MRNKKSKSDSTTEKMDMYILGGKDYSQMNPLVNCNILRGEQNLWDIGNQRYLAMEKLPLSGTFQTQPKPEEERDGRKY